MKKPNREVKRVGKEKSKKGQLAVIVLSVMVLLFAGMCIFRGKENPIPPIVSNEKEESNIGNTSKGYAVSASNKEAVLAAEKILKAGGNAADAAVALSYALAVVEPHASGLGGGGCMVIYDPAADDYFYYNYSSQASSNGYTGDILIPGFVSGMDKVLEDLGTMKYGEVIAPAIELCDGYKVDDELEKYINRNTGVLGKKSSFYKEGDWLEEGDTLKQPELKRTLELLVLEGSDAFYKGKIAKDITDTVGLSMEDFANYKTIVSSPVVGKYREYEIVSAGMPYSGTTLVQMLKMAEALEITNPSENNKEFIETLQKITVMSHAERVRNVYDYDAAGTVPDISKMVSDEHIKELILAEMPEYELEIESEDTTAFTIIDKDGMIVSATNTLSSFFGSKKEVDGFYLNNTGHNFGTGVNGFEPGKRPRSHIAPTILRSEDEAMAIATPGGDAILKVLSTVLIDICQFDTDPQEAVDKQRLMFVGNRTIQYEIGYEEPAIADPYYTDFISIPNSTHSLFGNISISGHRNKDGFYAVTDARRNGYSIFSNK